MSPATHRSAILPVAGAIVAACLALAVWFTRAGLPFVQHFTSISARPYESMADLASASDLVVRGTVDRIAGRQIDYGTQDPAEIAKGGGSPVVFYAVAVSETLQGESDGTIMVAGTDFGFFRVATDNETPLQRGQEVLLFLTRHTNTEKVGITLYDEFYVPVGRDNGVFDVKDDGQIVPRRPELFPGDEYTLREARTQVED